MQIEKCINKKTVAVMIPNLLGNIADWKKINKIAKKFNLKIIEDSADTIGYKVNNKTTGNLSDISTNSFYASHIINGAGTGGIVCFNDYKLYERAKLLRGWGRSSATFNESEEISKRLNVKKDEVISMNRRLLGKEKSLNDPIKDEDGAEWQDWVVDDKIDQELKLAQDQELSERKKLMDASIESLLRELIPLP